MGRKCKVLERRLSNVIQISKRKYIREYYRHKMDARKTISFIMIRYEMIFNYLSGQIIKIIFKQQGVVCEPIYRCTLNIPNKEKVSWQIFSDERNFYAKTWLLLFGNGIKRGYFQLSSFKRSITKDSR